MRFRLKRPGPGVTLVQDGGQNLWVDHVGSCSFESTSFAVQAPELLPPLHKTESEGAVAVSENAGTCDLRSSTKIMLLFHEQDRQSPF